MNLTKVKTDYQTERISYGGLVLSVIMMALAVGNRNTKNDTLIGGIILFAISTYTLGWWVSYIG